MADTCCGGGFKPRTSPYSFQGLGEEGLDLLAEAGEQFDLPVITEVLAPGDVTAVAARADVLQIGARNTQNFPPLKAVGRADRPVMLKRGMMASIEEWLAAAEYIVAHGNPNVFLCERGIQTFEDATRYTLDLSAVPVTQERTHLPVVVDPSHAAGTRRWVPALVRAALGVGADGVMVETHPNPDEALSGRRAVASSRRTPVTWLSLRAGIGVASLFPAAVWRREISQCVRRLDVRVGSLPVGRPYTVCRLSEQPTPLHE